MLGANSLDGKAANGGDRPIVATYDYADESGNLDRQIALHLNVQAPARAGAYRCDPLVCGIMGHGDLCPGCRLLARHRERTLDIIAAALTVHRDELRALLLNLLRDDIIDIAITICREAQHAAP